MVCRIFVEIFQTIFNILYNCNLSLVWHIAKSYSLWHSFHIRHFCKVSVELPFMALLWTHSCADRTAKYCSFTDTFFSPPKLPYMAVLRTLFRLSEIKTHKTADRSSSMDTFWLSEPIFMFGATELAFMAVLRPQIFRPTKLPYMAVLQTLFGCLSQNPYKTADLSSATDTFWL